MNVFDLEKEHPVTASHDIPHERGEELFDDANDSPRHECSCGHSALTGGHHHGANLAGGRLLFTMVINLVIPAIQVVGGLRAGSMALLSDAAHNFSDFTAVFIAWVANRIGQRGASAGNTFGYRRAEILAALINVAILTAAAAFILYEAFERLLHPEPVTAPLVIIIACVGIAGNGLSAWLLHRDAAHSLNIRGAFLHMIGDLLTSVVVAANGVVLLYKPWYWLDPLLSLLITLFIVKNCWGILREATGILMDATPIGINVEQVRDSLERLPGILGVHYLHAWNVCSSSIAFSCHVVVPDQSLSDIEPLSGRIREQLFRGFGIDHPVLQFETTPCGEAGTYCAMACSGPTPTGETKPAEEEGKKPKLSGKRIALGARLILGGIFIAAAVGKIIDPQAFAQTIYNYQILPDSLINATAVVLPWLELVLGLLLVGGVWLPGATLLAQGLLVVFFAALVFNMARGINIHCGCFGSGGTAPTDMRWYFIRDAFFLLLGGILFYDTLMKKR